MSRPLKLIGACLTVMLALVAMPVQAADTLEQMTIHPTDHRDAGDTDTALWIQQQSR